VPAGRFLSGSVLLKDNVELHLESGAVLISSLNPADITPFPQGGDGTDPDDTADGWEGGEPAPVTCYEEINNIVDARNGGATMLDL
jgi:hypothetical protein